MSVYVSTSKNYKKCYSAIKDVLDKLKLKIEGDIFIKPNISIPFNMDSGVVVNPKFIEAILDYFLERKGVRKIFIGDIPVIGYTSNEVLSSLKELKKDKRVKLLKLEDEEKKEFKSRYGIIKIPKIIFDTFYVNVPKLKTHMSTQVSFSLKNQKGLLDSEIKKAFHSKELDESIAHLSSIVSPDLIIVDGIIGMSGTGTRGMGLKKKAGFIIAGKNMVEVDAHAAAL